MNLFNFVKGKKLVYTDNGKQMPVTRILMEYDAKTGQFRFLCRLEGDGPLGFRDIYSVGPNDKVELTFHKDRKHN